MSGTTRAPAKKAAAKRGAAGPTPVAAPEEEKVSPEVQHKLDIEQKNFEIATIQSQCNYLMARVAELVKENHKLGGGE